MPARSDTALVTSYTYNAAGWVQDVIDPRGIDDRTTYDHHDRPRYDDVDGRHHHCPHSAGQNHYHPGQNHYHPGQDHYDPGQDRSQKGMGAPRSPADPVAGGVHPGWCVVGG